MRAEYRVDSGAGGSWGVGVGLQRVWTTTPMSPWEKMGSTPIRPGSILEGGCPPKL